MTDADRVVETAAMLRRAAAELGHVVSGDDRVSEVGLAELMGYSRSAIKLMREEGRGPVPYPIGMAGCRWSYRLGDVAAWIEGRRDNNG
jgi:hypothetical protein